MRSSECEDNMSWEYQAAANFKLIFSDTLAHKSIEQLAARLVRLFYNVKNYNESIRTNTEIPPEVKLWLVIPS